MSRATSFADFSPKDYLQEYFPENKLDDEDIFHLRGLEQIYSLLPLCDTLVEVGGGPTIYQLISAASRVRSIYFTDYLVPNIVEVKRWVENDPEAYHWAAHFALVANEMASRGLKVDVLELKKELRRKITAFGRCDLFSDAPLLDAPGAQFSVVSSHFCAESICDTRELFELAMRNLFRLVEPRGYLITALLIHSESYAVGNRDFLAYRVSEAAATSLLRKSGFVIRKQMTLLNLDKVRRYRGVMLLLAQRAPERP